MKFKILLKEIKGTELRDASEYATFDKEIEEWRASRKCKNIKRANINIYARYYKIWHKKIEKYIIPKVFISFKAICFINLVLENERR
ncbi:MAG: hypothetical protein ACE5KT_06280 [Methanosarcinales archaeon]